MNANAKILALSIFEGAMTVLEQEAQVPPQPAAPPPGQEAPMQVQNAPASSNGQPLTIDQLIERLNVIRGGKSFSDPEVYGSLVTLYKSINDADKQSLDNILMEIGKVVINAETAEPQSAPTGTQQNAQTQQGQGPATPPGGAAPVAQPAPAGAAPAV